MHRARRVPLLQPLAAGLVALSLVACGGTTAGWTTAPATAGAVAAATAAFRTPSGRLHPSQPPSRPKPSLRRLRAQTRR